MILDRYAGHIISSMVESQPIFQKESKNKKSMVLWVKHLSSEAKSQESEHE
jgi:hypothetical protein